MKKHLTSILLLMLVVSMVVFGNIGCNKKIGSDNFYDLTVGKTPSGYVVVAPKITTKDYEAVEKSMRKISVSGACTAHTWTTDKGKKAEVRNLDFFYTENPAIAYYFDVPGYYKSWNFTLLTGNGQSYESMLKDGVDKDVMKIATSMPFDALNEKGLYLEVNIRSAEYDLNTGDYKWDCMTGSNPTATETRSIAVFGREIANNCATVKEAIEYANQINWVLNVDCGYFLAWYVNDATSSALFELVDNKLKITEGVKTNSNYFVNEEYKDQVLFDMGIGRTEYVEKNITDGMSYSDGVNKMLDMYYSQIYYEDCIFNRNSEFEGYYSDDLFITKENKDDNISGYVDLIKYYGEKFEEKTNIKKMTDAVNWHTVYSTSINWKNPSKITLRFMEDESMTYTFDVSNGKISK
ncbi:MAG: hypothetical protein MJ066_02340 [Clostridia bacterium]|nr:hypothetical protein [Clostridia bacterium]